MWSFSLVSEEPVFTANAVARRIGRLTGAGRHHHALQNGAAALAGPLADDLPDLGGFGVLKDVSIGIGDALHHIGLHQVSAVDHCGPCCQQLDGGHFEALAEGCSGQVGDAVGTGKEVLGPEHAVIRLAHHVNAGLGEKPKVLYILVEFLRTQPLSDGDEGRVAGVGHRLGQTLGAMAGTLGAAHGPVGHCGRAAARKESFSLTTPSSSAAARTMDLKVEPGS